MQYNRFRYSTTGSDTVQQVRIQYNRFGYSATGSDTVQQVRIQYNGFGYSTTGSDTVQQVRIQYNRFGYSATGSDTYRSLKITFSFLKIFLYSRTWIDEVHSEHENNEDYIFKHFYSNSSSEKQKRYNLVVYKIRTLPC